MKKFKFVQHGKSEHTRMRWTQEAKNLEEAKKHLMNFLHNSVQYDYLDNPIWPKWWTITECK